MLLIPEVTQFSFKYGESQSRAVSSEDLLQFFANSEESVPPPSQRFLQLVNSLQKNSLSLFLPLEPGQRSWVLWKL
jgi:hypothetical protein